MTELELFDKLNPKRDLPQAICDVISQVYKVMQKDNDEKDKQIEELKACNEKLLDINIEKQNKIEKLLDINIEKQNKIVSLEAQIEKMKSDYEQLLDEKN